MDIVEAIIRGAPQILNPNGTLQMVVRSKIGKKPSPNLHRNLWQLPNIIHKKWLSRTLRSKAVITKFHNPVSPRLIVLIWVQLILKYRIKYEYFMRLLKEWAAIGVNASEKYVFKKVRVKSRVHLCNKS